MNKLFLLPLFLPLLLFAQSQMIIPDNRRINELLTKDIEDITFQSPMILNSSILFFYKGKAKSVSLSGDFNNWQDNLIMEESRSNLWVLSLKHRIPAGVYRYRIKVDGFWIADPLNPDFEYDSGHQKLSLFKMNKEFTPQKKFPFWVSNNTYLFQYQSTNANIITIVGDFNNWNPYANQLKHKGANIYEIELELAPKKIYLYSFVQDGFWTFDPNNRQQYRNAQDRPVSGFYADGTNSIP